MRAALCGFGSVPALNVRARASQDIFVFVVGGATYEEARAVALLNAANKGQRIVLGSTCMLNSTAFLKDLEKALPNV